MFINLYDYIKTYFRLPLYDMYSINQDIKLDLFEHKFYESNSSYKVDDYEYYLVKVNDKNLGIIQNLSTDLVEILYNITKEISRYGDDIYYYEGCINIIDTSKQFITRYDKIKHYITFEKIVKMN